MVEVEKRGWGVGSGRIDQGDEESSAAVAAEAAGESVGKVCKLSRSGTRLYQSHGLEGVPKLAWQYSPISEREDGDGGGGAIAKSSRLKSMHFLAER